MSVWPPRRIRSFQAAVEGERGPGHRRTPGRAGERALSGRTILRHSFGDRDDDRFVQASFEELPDLIGRTVPGANLIVERLRGRQHPELLGLLESGDIRAAVR